MKLFNIETWTPVVAATSAALLLLSACASQKSAAEKARDNAETQQFSDAPEWASAAPDGCGVGVTEYRGNRGLARDGAVSNARSELAGQLRARTESMTKDYQAQGEADGEDFSESRLTSVVRQVVDQTLAGTTVEATYVTEDAEATHYYAMVCLEPGTYAESFEKMEGLSEKQRRALEQRAHQEFEHLSEATE